MPQQLHEAAVRSWLRCSPLQSRGDAPAFGGGTVLRRARAAPGGARGGPPPHHSDVEMAAIVPAIIAVVVTYVRPAVGSVSGLCRRAATVVIEDDQCNLADYSDDGHGLAVGDARAQSMIRFFPFACTSSLGGGSYYRCSYYTMEQCRASANGQMQPQPILRWYDGIG